MSGFIYFIRPVSMSGPVKIGFSAQPRERMENLAVWSPFPLQIVLQIPGTFRLEKNLHECLANAHSHHEWFFATDKVIALIEALSAGKPIEEAIDLAAREGRMPRKPMSAEARLRLTYLHRIRHHTSAPADVEKILERWSDFRGSPPTETEMRRLEEVLPYRGKPRANAPAALAPQEAM